MPIVPIVASRSFWFQFHKISWMIVGHFACSLFLWQLIEDYLSFDMQKGGLSGTQTVKMQERLHKCTVLLEPWLFANAVYRHRRSLKRKARDHGPMKGWACWFEWLKLIWSLSILFAWCSLLYIFQWGAPSSWQWY